ncbi:hypothetical protein [Streptomyces rapamycinicus]|uniref:Uncharacterized protein n=2 Tax=Streptomyces rapamycinicus TaxID=1226757 RepID=A0A0A0N9S8_STRRN|nr:hypothetical protein [Streptomyces rapamycinicus]AGP56197.1 hypothetical protein M271_23435 [Streptomyces rapamycinicus NRRL 5491]MBB4783806.1 uncharacterized protein HemX [Streptomyces rapamycinicus]RLV80722.1 hypothetical protein D3C57_120095 [Streptomyces rapamycinicus NRRL 5491]UTO64163.1 hypothetical protein LJB45_18725 [Streptomyces rapamycinicus]UTP32118.1 hypothetical protein LIV37_23845 [Streptomyces rapamycinicus NRRL 5491]
MDATTLGALGSLLVGAGGLAAAVVAWLGKRGENALTGYSSLTNDLQEERDALRLQLTELHAQRSADQAEITRLRIEIARLGGQP